MSNANPQLTGIDMGFRRLSHGFTVRCTDQPIRDYVASVLHRFALDDRRDGTVYEVLDLGSSATEARFRLLVDGGWVLGSSNPAHILNDLFAHVNLDTVEATRDLVLVHGGAVSTSSRDGVVLPAPSGSGKTTLVAGLVRAGFGYLSDEAAVLDPGTPTLLPSPTHLSLKAGSWSLFPEVAPDPVTAALSGDTWHVDPEDIRPRSVGQPCTVGFVVPHRFEAGAKTTVEPLSPAEACVELGRNLMAARRDAPRALDLLGRICQGSSCNRLTWGDLDEAVETIQQLTAR